MPAMPHSAAGPRIDPPVSDPVPPMISPAATAAPVPDDDPAVKRSLFQGLRAGGHGTSNDGPPKANSCVASLPSMTAPASAHFFDGVRVARRHVVLQEPGMRRRADAGRVVDVLVGDRDAVERSAQRARHLPRFGGLGVRQRALLGHHQERIQLRIEAADALEMRFGELDRRQLLGRNELRGLGDGQNRHQSCSTSKVSAGSASRGSGAWMRRDHALDDVGTRQDCLHLIGRQGEPCPLQQDGEFGFVDRGRHGHSFHLPGGAR